MRPCVTVFRLNCWQVIMSLALSRYRFVELYYRRSESTHKGRLVPARVETVVLFLPDIWSCLPTRLEWDGLQQSYRKQWENIVTSSAAPADPVTAVSSPIEQDEANSGSTAAASADEKALLILKSSGDILVLLLESSKEMLILGMFWFNHLIIFNFTSNRVVKNIIRSQV